MTCNLHGMTHNPRTAGNRRSLLRWRSASLWLFGSLLGQVHDVLKLSWAVLHVLTGWLARLHNPKSCIMLNGRGPSVPSPLRFTDTEGEVKMGKMLHQGNSEGLLTSREQSSPLPPHPQTPFRHLQAFLFTHCSGAKVVADVPEIFDS